jgi:tRNA threonylcarbamoyl adenosine modification protein (Sua5/YciO/YrdC/YwlC family)
VAKHIYTYINPLAEKHISEALRLLENDGLIAYPTDVNWAVGCAADSVKAVRRIQQLKNDHPKGQPFTLLCNSLSMVAQVAVVEQSTFRYLRKILPGPYTAILPSNKGLPKIIHDKRKSVGIRIPACPLVLGLITALGRPLLTSSLPHGEQFGDEAIRFGYDIEGRFGHQIDLILDLGEEVISGETTIVDFTSGSPEVIRKGLGDVSIFAGG